MKNEEKNLGSRVGMLGFGSPEGTFENSPAFQRRERVTGHTSSEGTAESTFLSGSFGTNQNGNESAIGVWQTLFFVLHSSFYIIWR